MHKFAWVIAAGFVDILSLDLEWLLKGGNKGYLVCLCDDGPGLNILEEAWTLVPPYCST